MNKEPELEDFKREWNACLNASEPLLQPSQEVLDELFYEAVRRRKMRVVRRRRIWSIAASVALVIGVGIEVMYSGKEEQSPIVAENHQQLSRDAIHRVSHEEKVTEMPAPSRGRRDESRLYREEVVASDPDPDIPTSFPHRSPAEPIYCAEAFPEEDPGPSHASECNFDCSLLAELNINPLKIFEI